MRVSYLFENAQKCSSLGTLARNFFFVVGVVGVVVDVPPPPGGRARTANNTRYISA